MIAFLFVLLVVAVLAAACVRNARRVARESERAGQSLRRNRKHYLTRRAARRAAR